MKGFGVMGYGCNVDGKGLFIASDEKARGIRSNDAKKEIS